MAVFHLYEIVSVRHRYPRPHWKGAVVTMSICAAYMIWIFYVHHVGQFWVYPVLGYLGPKGRAAFLAACAGLGACLYFGGGVLNAVVWGRLEREE